MKKRNTIIYSSIISVCVLVIVSIYVFPSIYQNICKERVYKDIQANISQDVCSANIRIVTKLTQKSENVESYSCGETGCGVIIDYRDGYYYVLTAAHVVDGKTELKPMITFESKKEVICEYFVVSFGEPTYDMARKQSKEHIPVDDFYDKFQKATVEYVSDECDIAVIKFKSAEKYTCLQLSENEIEYNDRIVIFGKSDEAGSLINYGKIISKNYKQFEVHDGRNADKVLYHDAYEMPGYSGSAVLNDKMEIVGINIGGGTDFLGRFRHGVMIPVSIIKTILDTNEY